MRVLLVEDDPMIGRAVADGLQGEGHAVDLVFDGAAAELALLHGPYDLAVLDLPAGCRIGSTAPSEAGLEGTTLCNSRVFMRRSFRG